MNENFNILKRLGFNFTNPDNLYFLHIPKTSGTSVTHFLRQHYEAEEVIPQQTWNELYGHLEQLGETDVVEFLNRFKLIMGHYGYGLLKHYLTGNVITMLRDPVERTISQLCHIKSDPIYNNWVHTRFCLPGENITNLIENTHRIKVFENYQTRYLALNLDFPRIIKKSSFHGKDLLFDSNNKFVNTDKSESELLQIALSHIKNFKLVGVQDYVEESMILLAHKMGWQPPDKMERKMSATDQEQKSLLNDMHFEILRKISAADRALYEHCKKAFENEYITLLNTKLGKTLTWGQFIQNRDGFNSRLRERLSDELFQSVSE